MPNYQNGKIYKIESYIGNCIYYGSTTLKYLSTRLAKHKSDVKRGVNITSSKVLQYEDAKIYLVELYPCNSKEELHMREGWYIKNNDCVNKMVAGRTTKQYKLDNKEKYNQYNKQYYSDNKERLLQKQKAYGKNNKEMISHKKKQYYIDNILKIKELKSKQYICDCGSIYTHNHYKRHTRSKHHIAHMDNPFINFKL